MDVDITVVIPTIPPRAAMLQRALASVSAQTRSAAAISVAVDVRRDGAARTRQRALDAVRTGWTAFLDDDDELLPEHLEHLLACALAQQADYVYSWFKVVTPGGIVLERDPVFPETHYTEPWDDAHPRQTTVTTLVRTELAQDVGFWKPYDDAEVDGQRAGEDWDFTLGCLKRGAKIHHLVEKTWLWHHHGHNTSGMSDRW
jgi:hypothetical protein